MSDYSRPLDKNFTTSAELTADTPSDLPASKDNNLELLWGAEQIAAELNVTTRRARYLLEQGEIPAQKVGGRWCTSRASLRKRFEVA